MQLIFDSIEEVQDFVKKLKGTRGGKADKDDAPETTSQNAPAPLAPPPNAPAFNPGGVGQQQPAFNPTPSAPAIDPALKGIVDRINTRIDAAIASGQPADSVLTWFRQQCGPEAVNADLKQIKEIVLLKMNMPVLEGIAKLMNA